jgi:hypothetical protein
MSSAQLPSSSSSHISTMTLMAMILLVARLLDDAEGARADDAHVLVLVAVSDRTAVRRQLSFVTPPVGGELISLSRMRPRPPKYRIEVSSSKIQALILDTTTTHFPAFTSIFTGRRWHPGHGCG